MITRNGLNEGIYFVKIENAKEYIEECKKRKIQGVFKIEKI